MADSQFSFDGLFAKNAPVAKEAPVVKRGKYDFAVAYPDPASLPLEGLLDGLKEAMAEEGFFADTEAARDFANRLEVLDQDPSRQDLAWLLGLDDDVLDPRIRYREIGNWVERMVLPRMIRRG